jgi:hypothetical protein
MILSGGIWVQSGPNTVPLSSLSSIPNYNPPNSTPGSLLTWALLQLINLHLLPELTDLMNVGQDILGVVLFNGVAELELNEPLKFSVKATHVGREQCVTFTFGQGLIGPHSLPTIPLTHLPSIFLHQQNSLQLIFPLAKYNQIPHCKWWINL